MYNYFDDIGYSKFLQSKPIVVTNAMIRVSVDIIQTPEVVRIEEEAGAAVQTGVNVVV